VWSNGRLAQLLGALDGALGAIECVLVGREAALGSKAMPLSRLLRILRPIGQMLGPQQPHGRLSTPTGAATLP
jgi:hypothetical protein